MTAPRGEEDVERTLYGRLGASGWAPRGLVFDHGDAQAWRRHGGRVAEGHRDAPPVDLVGPGQYGQGGGDIDHPPGERPDHGPAVGVRADARKVARVRHEPERRLQPDHAAPGRR
jgi:hypothetical protein